MRATPRPAAVFSIPWHDRSGRFSPLRAATFAATLIPGAVLAVQFGLDALGPEPLVALEHETGLWAVRLLLISLLVTPLRHLADWPRVVVLRRMLGLAALAYALVHLLLYVAVEHFRLLHAAAEILRRTYLTIGFAALLGLVVLGVTSTDGWVRSLGARWKRLHRLVFPLTALGLLHFLLQSKLDITEAALTAGLFLWLLGWRLLPGPARASPAALLGLAAASALLTAGLEAGWYAVASGVPPLAVLAANLDVSFGLSAALWVGVTGLAAAAVPLLRRVGGRVAARA